MESMKRVTTARILKKITLVDISTISADDI
jgi:hypothetical protein